MASVFLSYRQGDAPHTQRVRELALKLRAAGLTVTLDSLHNDERCHKGGPDEGWLTWSYAQVDANDKVLLIGSASYYQVYEGKAQPGVGVGAAIEARRIFVQLAKAKGVNPRFRVVLLAPGDDVGTPDHLADYQHFRPNDSTNGFGGFTDLVTWLHAPVAGAAATPALPSPTAPTPPATPSGFPISPVTVDRRDFVDCRRAFEAFEQMLVAGSPKRILLLEGHGAHGKSKLLNLLHLHTRSLLGITSVARVELKHPLRSPEELLLELAHALRLPAPAGANATLQTHALLAACAHRPVVLFIDVYDGHVVSNDVFTRWVGLFLASALDNPNLRLVVAGRCVPTWEAQLWEECTVHTHCDAMQDRDAVRDYATRRGYKGRLEDIDVLRNTYLSLRLRYPDQIHFKLLLEEIQTHCVRGTTLS